SSTLPAAAHCAISIAAPVRPRRYGVPGPLCLLKRTWRLRLRVWLGAKRRCSLLGLSCPRSGHSLSNLATKKRHSAGHVPSLDLLTDHMLGLELGAPLRDYL